MLKIENLTKTYGDFTAVNNISFEVKNGKIGIQNKQVPRVKANTKGKSKYQR